jgi:hypothetical protein
MTIWRVVYRLILYLYEVSYPIVLLEEASI